MRWHEQYLGRPWAHSPKPPESFNCGELLRFIYRERFGIETPLIVADTLDLRSCIKDIREIGRYWNFQRVDMPRDFDIAVMSRSVEADHVGICVGGDILHCRPKVGVFLDDVFTLRNMGWRGIQYIRPLGLPA